MKHMHYLALGLLILTNGIKLYSVAVLCHMHEHIPEVVHEDHDNASEKRQRNQRHQPIL